MYPLTLVHPVTHQPLRYDESAQAYRDPSSGQEFPLRNGIGIFRPDDAAVRNAGLHSDRSTQFRYVDHYEQDARVFDYFEEAAGAAARCEQESLHQVILSGIRGDALLVLDAGCGSAWVARMMCSLGHTVFSLDISTRNPERALQENPHPCHFGIVADIFSLPFADGSFDVVISSEVMEHVPDPVAYLKELYRVLKAGGTMILTTPYNEKPEYSLCVHCNQPTPRHAHLHQVEEQRASAWLAAAGIRDFRFRTFHQHHLVRSGIIVPLMKLSPRLWWLADRLGCRLFGRPSRFLVRIRKENQTKPI